MRAAAPFELKQPRVWLLPLLAALGALAVYATNANEILFRLTNRLGPETTDWLWANITILGDTLVVLTLCLVVARRRPDMLWAVMVVALLSTAWVHTHKPLFDVVRPPGVLDLKSFHVIGPAHQYHSFPSGHTTSAFAIAGGCVLGFGLRAWAIVPIGIAILVAISRVVVGVHWPLDLLWGAVGGWLAAAVGLKLAARMSFGMHPVTQWIITVALAGCALALLFTHDTRYPQAIGLQRVIAIVCLAALAQTFMRRTRGTAPG